MKHIITAGDLGDRPPSSQLYLASSQTVLLAMVYGEATPSAIHNIGLLTHGASLIYLH